MSCYRSLKSASVVEFFPQSRRVSQNALFATEICQSASAVS